MQTLYFLLQTSLLISLSASVNLPSYFPRCYQIEYYKDDVEYADCIMKAAYEAREFLVKGLPEIGIPSISGITVPKINVEQKTRAVQFNISLVNLTVNGLENYKIKSLTYSNLNTSYNGELALPKLKLNGIYFIRGRIFDQNIYRKGPVEAEITNTTLKCLVNIHLYEKKGVTFINISKIIIDVNIGNAVGKFGNLFGEAESLNRAVNAFLEQSTTDIVKIALPDFKDFVSKLFLKVVSRLARVVPYDSIFLKPEKKS